MTEAIIPLDEPGAVEAAAPPADEQLKRIALLAEQHGELQNYAAELEAQLTNVNARIKTLIEVDLPNAMNAVGLRDFTLTDGTAIEIATAVNAGIPKPRTAEAHDWLEAHGHGGLIKRRIQILFGREDVAWAKKFLADCRKRTKKLNIDEKKWVEPQTLQGWAREQVRTAIQEHKDPEKAIPFDLFGVFKRNYAKITLPEAPE